MRLAVDATSFAFERPSLALVRKAGGPDMLFLTEWAPDGADATELFPISFPKPDSELDTDDVILLGRQKKYSHLEVVSM